MAYGTISSNIMDIPMSVSSVVSPYIGDNGYKFVDYQTVRVLSIANGTVSDYVETSATAAFGATPTLVSPNEQLLTLAYNKCMWLRIQQTQIQDIPVSQFGKQVALQQANEVFVPTHDAYSIAKVYAARLVGNKVLFNATAGTNDLVLQFSRMVRKSTSQGGMLNSILVWVDMDIAAQINRLVNFTGSDAGYGDGKKGYLGQMAGAKCIEVPTSYMAGVYAICFDKHAVINVAPKMDPKANGLKIIEDVPGFGGIEIQLRDRGDTFVLNQKIRLISTLESA